MDVQRARQLDAMYTDTMEQDDPEDGMLRPDLRDDEEEMVDRMELFLPVVQSLVNALGGYEVRRCHCLPVNCDLSNMKLSYRMSLTQKPKRYKQLTFPVTLVWPYCAISKGFGGKTTRTTSELFFDASIVVT